MTHHEWLWVCLPVQDGDALEVDLLATAFDDKARPHPLRHRHVAGYLQRVRQLGGSWRPEQGPVQKHCAHSGHLLEEQQPSMHACRTTHS
jgi:hypothetical protein